MTIRSSWKTGKVGGFREIPGSKVLTPNHHSHHHHQEDVLKEDVFKTDKDVPEVLNVGGTGLETDQRDDDLSRP